MKAYTYTTSNGTSFEKMQKKKKGMETLQYIPLKIASQEDDSTLGHIQNKNSIFYLFTCNDLYSRSKRIVLIFGKKAKNITNFLPHVKTHLKCDEVYFELFLLCVFCYVEFCENQRQKKEFDIKQAISESKSTKKRIPVVRQKCQLVVNKDISTTPTTLPPSATSHIVQHVPLPNSLFKDMMEEKNRSLFSIEYLIVQCKYFLYILGRREETVEPYFLKGLYCNLLQSIAPSI